MDGGLVTTAALAQPLDPAASPWLPAGGAYTHEGDARTKRKHKCDLCEHSESLIMDMWKHKALTHGEAYSEDIIIYALTEQNFELDKKVKMLEEATIENIAEVKKVLQLVEHKGLTMGHIVESQAKLIIDNLTIHRKVDDMVEPKPKPEEKKEEHRTLWVGTSLSDQHLDVPQLENKTGGKVDKLKAFTITRNEGKKNPNLNAEELIPKALDSKKYDIIVIEMGVNEISNLKIGLEEHILKEEVHNKMEKLFHMTLQYITDHPNLKVVVLNRLPRLDSTSRASLSREADRAMVKLWEENGQPRNIILESLHLQVGSRKEKEEVFGHHLGNRSYGIHLRGVAGKKEFSYRAARLLLRVLGKGQVEEKRRAGAGNRGAEKNRMEDSRKRENTRQEEIKRKEQNRKLEEKNRRL